MEMLGSFPDLYNLAGPAVTTFAGSLGLGTIEKAPRLGKGAGA